MSGGALTPPRRPASEGVALPRTPVLGRGCGQGGACQPHPRRSHVALRHPPPSFTRGHQGCSRICLPIRTRAVLVATAANWLRTGEVLPGHRDDPEVSLTPVSTH
ncbi:hypothetical protein H8959_000033 [Pygathrix nigripes]